MEAIFHNIADLDFSEKRWPTLLPNILTLLKTPEIRVVLGGLRALCILIRLFEYASSSRRLPLENISQTTFPALLELFKNAISQQSEESDEIQAAILRCFAATTFSALPKFILEDHHTHFTPWLELIHTNCIFLKPLGSLSFSCPSIYNSFLNFLHDDFFSIFVIILICISSLIV